MKQLLTIIYDYKTNDRCGDVSLMKDLYNMDKWSLSVRDGNTFHWKSVIPSRSQSFSRSVINHRQQGNEFKSRTSFILSKRRLIKLLLISVWFTYWLWLLLSERSSEFYYTERNQHHQTYSNFKVEVFNFDTVNYCT